MRLNKESRKICKELFRESFTDKKLDETKVREFVARIAGTKPRHYIDILKNYQRLIRLESQKYHALVESAAPLDTATSRRIETELKARHGNDLAIEFKVSPELIGGLRIKIGSDVWDGSVRHRLERLSRQFEEV
jgi:F-type H+-transporting ATPase subunit delta